MASCMPFDTRKLRLDGRNSRKRYLIYDMLVLGTIGALI